jgi:hypothetical protein
MAKRLSIVAPGKAWCVKKSSSSANTMKKPRRAGLDPFHAVRWLVGLRCIERGKSLFGMGQGGQGPTDRLAVTHHVPARQKAQITQLFRDRAADYRHDS